MKNLRFITLFTTLLLSFFLLETNAQTTSHSPTNKINISKFNGIWSGFIATYPEGNKSTEICIECNSIPQCKNNQILIQRTCTKCAYCVDKSNDDILNFVTGFLGDVFGNIASTLGINLQSPSPSPSPSPSGASPEPSNTVSPPAKHLSPSGTISLNLTVKNGDIKGTVQAEDLISTGTIVSENTISTEEIELNTKDKNGKVILLKLKLLGQPTYTGILANGVLIEGKIFTPFYSYLVPSKTISTVTSQPSVQPSPSPSPKPSPSPSPSPSPKQSKGRPGTRRAGGEDAGRAGGETAGRAGGESAGRAGGDDGGRAGGESGRAGGDDGGRAGGEDE
jgi:hypothetical protein